MVGILNGQKIMDEDDGRVDRWEMVAMMDHHIVARMGICIRRTDGCIVGCTSRRMDEAGVWMDWQRLRWLNGSWCNDNRAQHNPNGADDNNNWTLMRSCKIRARLKRFYRHVWVFGHRRRNLSKIEYEDVMAQEDMCGLG